MRLRPVMERRALLTGVIASLCVLAVAIAAPAALSRVEERAIDGMLVAGGARPPSDRVVVVAIDDRSVAELGQWPWPRGVVAQFVDSLNASGAAAVGYDVLFAEPERGAGGAGGGDDRLQPSARDSVLAKALARGPNVLGVGFTFGRTAGPDDGGCLFQPAPVVAVGALPLTSLFQPSGAICALPLFARAVQGTGFLNASADGDGILRRVPLFMSFDGQMHASLAMRTLALAQGEPLRVRLGEDNQLTVSAGGQTLRLDSRATMRVRFRGPAETFEHISAVDVLRGRVRPGVLRGRLAFVGLTGLGLRDVVATPFDAAYHGVEVHATVAADVLAGTTLRSPTGARLLWWLVTLVLGVGASVAVWRLGLTRGAVLSLAAVAALWLAAYRSVNGPGVVYTPLYPTLSVALTLMALTVLSWRQEGSRADAERVRREQTRDFAVSSLTSLVETRDRSTGQHAKRTGELVAVLATQLNTVPKYRGKLPEDYVKLLARLAVLHDIGKVGIADAVLNKPGKLSDDEYEQMKRHPELGYETILRAEREAGLTDGAEADILALAKDLVRTHHEHWDGKGYPHGLAGEAIPLPGRIMAVVDVYDALVQPRVYRGPLPHEVGVEHILKGRGTAFDPDVVDAFLAVEQHIKALTAKFGADPAAAGLS